MQMVTAAKLLGLEKVPVDGPYALKAQLAWFAIGHHSCLSAKLSCQIVSDHRHCKLFMEHRFGSRQYRLGVDYDFYVANVYLYVISAGVQLTYCLGGSLQIGGNVHPKVGAYFEFVKCRFYETVVRQVVSVGSLLS